MSLKDSTFEPSSPLTELYSLLINSDSSISTKPIMFLYSDGGPDHHLTYVSVQLSLVCIFLKLDLDYLCACQTAPYHSWKNPIERVMSVLAYNVLESGTTRSFEVSKCNTLSELHKIASTFVSAVEDC